MKITVLAENVSAHENIGAEHGLSLYIETSEHKILFDMGQSSLFTENAEKLGVDLSDIDAAVLSHGHYDHGGGLGEFLELNRTAPVYLSRFAFEPHYNGTEKYIGLDTSLAKSDRLIFTDDSCKIGEGLTLFTCNSFDKKHGMSSAGMLILQNDTFSPDDFRHEQYLLIEESGKKILISGCSHKGILNIAEWFAPHVLIGGFHFSKLPLDGVLTGYAKYLDGFDTDFYTCHCTGTAQFEFMKQHMSRLFYLSCGDTITI